MTGMHLPVNCMVMTRVARLCNHAVGPHVRVQTTTALHACASRRAPLMMTPTELIEAS